jgi:diguanylate cyclase (GGDEF)-like protein
VPARRRGALFVTGLLPAAVLAADPLLLALAGSRAARPATELLVLAAFALGSSRKPGFVVRALPLLAVAWWVAERPALSVGVPRLLAAGLMWTVIGELVATGRLRAARRLVAVRSLSETDPLTAVGNRRALQHALDVLPVGGVVTVLDIDHFKIFNDRFGHVAGDVVLRDFARVLAGAVRSGDSVSRYGGEEFVLVVNDPADAADLFHRIRTAWEAETPPVTFSAGLAARRLMEAAADTLCRADAALYEAKAAGRDRFAGVVPELASPRLV